MDTKESKTREEEKEHVKNVLKPEDFDKSKPELQPEAKKPPSKMNKLLPLVIIIVGILVVGLLMFGTGSSSG